MELKSLLCVVTEVPLISSGWRQNEVMQINTNPGDFPWISNV